MRLNALALGEAVAGHVGIDVARLRTQVIVAVALLCALAVAWCGAIGFIGLMAPHLVRQWVGADHRRVLPLSMAAGALLLLAGRHRWRAPWPCRPRCRWASSPR